MSFTLIELLVVVAIIALLASLLLPALKSARAKAKQAACLSNLRQVSFAHYAYADEFGAFIWFHNSTNAPTHWQVYLGRNYLNEPKDNQYSSRQQILRSTMHCPADTTEHNLYSPGWGPTRCIAINGTMYADLSFGGQTWPGPIGITMRRLSSIGLPAELALVGDGTSAEWNTEWGNGARFFFDAYPDDDLESMARHNDQINVVMVDGHGESKSRGWFRAEVSHMWGWQPPPSKFLDWSAVYQ